MTLSNVPSDLTNAKDKVDIAWMKLQEAVKEYNELLKRVNVNDI